MSRIGPKDTKPEVFIRKLVHGLGYRFRLHKKDLPGKPDLAFPKFKKVIFVNGCFWHGHEGCKKSTLPTTNADFWATKINKNIANDLNCYEKLTAQGWGILVLWQCEIKKKNVEELIDRITAFLR